MNLTKEERETHIYYNEEKDCIATIVTFQTKLKNKIRERAKEDPNVRILREEDGEIIAEMPKKYISVSIKKPSSKRGLKNMTEEHKNKLINGRRKSNGEESS